nr:hypothetical protein CFP56_74309 [Quercus suber]
MNVHRRAIEWRTLTYDSLSVSLDCRAHHTPSWVPPNGGVCRYPACHIRVEVRKSDGKLSPDLMEHYQMDLTLIPIHRLFLHEARACKICCSSDFGLRSCNDAAG